MNDASDKIYHSSDAAGNFLNQSRVEIDEPELRRRHQQQRFRGGVHRGQVSGGPPDEAHDLANDTAERPGVRARDWAGTGRLPGRAALRAPGLKGPHAGPVTDALLGQDVEPLAWLCDMARWCHWIDKGDGEAEARRRFERLFEDGIEPHPGSRVDCICV